MIQNNLKNYKNDIYICSLEITYYLNKPNFAIMYFIPIIKLQIQYYELIYVTINALHLPKKL